MWVENGFPIGSCRKLPTPLLVLGHAVGVSNPRATDVQIAMQPGLTAAQRPVLRIQKWEITSEEDKDEDLRAWIDRPF